jgi:hypothetical protein
MGKGTRNEILVGLLGYAFGNMNVKDARNLQASHVKYVP